MNQENDSFSQEGWGSLAKADTPINVQLEYKDTSFLFSYCALRLFNPIIGLVDESNDRDSVRVVKANKTMMNELTDRLAMALYQKRPQEQIDLVLTPIEINLLEKDLETQLEFAPDEEMIKNANNVLQKIKKDLVEKYHDN